jgi:hypothetical protein
VTHIGSEWLELSYVEVSYPKEARVARTLANSAFAAWTSVKLEVLSTFGAFANVASIALAARTSATGSGLVALAYWVETYISDFELHYSVSLDGGATLGDWSSAAQLLVDREAPEFDNVTVAADPTGDDVVVGYVSHAVTDAGLHILGSDDKAATCSAASCPAGRTTSPRRRWPVVPPSATWTTTVWWMSSPH